MYPGGVIMSCLDSFNSSFTSQPFPASYNVLLLSIFYLNISGSPFSFSPYTRLLVLKITKKEATKMAHSKRNTSLPHFTSYERGLLRNHWGTKRGVIGRDSFLPFASCRLCLQPARSPVVACATNGDLFCRECAISDLLAQRNDIKRVERERADAKKRLAEDDERTMEEAREREVREFELVSMGLEGNGDQNKKKKRKAGEVGEEELDRDREVVVGGKRKKVFELDEKEMARVVGEEQERLKEELKKEKVSIFPVSSPF